MDEEQEAYKYRYLGIIRGSDYDIGVVNIERIVVASRYVIFRCMTYFCKLLSQRGWRRVDLEG